MQDKKVIIKSNLIEGHWYINRNNGRGMRIGMWDGKMFHCIKGPKFGQYSEYLMNHVENDDGYVLFEPIIDLEYILDENPSIKY